MAKTYTGDISGDLKLFDGDDATGVTIISGFLYVREGATADLPACTSIGGGLEIKPSCQLRAPMLETIKGERISDAAGAEGVNSHE